MKPKWYRRRWVRTISPPVGVVFAEGQWVVSVSNIPTVKPGDQFTAIDGVPIADVVAALRRRLGASTEAQMEVMLAGALLQGPAEQPVRVRMRRPDGSAYAADLPRTAAGAAPLPVVTDRQVEGFGYIKVRALGGDAVARFDAALEKYRTAPGLILDLRGNGGGSDTLAEEMAGRLLSQTTTFTRIKLRFAPFWGPTLSHRVSPRGPWQYEGPVVLLFDGAVFSSCDFFAGGLARSGRVTTIGTPTGGGSGNPILITLPGGARARISRWIESFADGTPVEGNGTRPEIEVRPTIADIAAGRDRVLEKAVEVLRGKIQ